MLNRLLAATNPTSGADKTINIAPGGGGEAQFGALKDITIGGLISGAISLALLVAAVVFFFMLVIGGIKWITSGGDKGQTEAARSQITAALVGLVIVFAAWAIAQLISSLFGITIFSGSFQLPTFTSGAAK
ncbi:MAG TPA: hypothetical protein VF185_02105 [Patescibacteria group bacterium]